MLRQGAVHRENRFSSWRNETGLLRFFGNKTTQFFSGQSDWPADNSRKVRLAGMPATAVSLPPMCMYISMPFEQAPPKKKILYTLCYTFAWSDLICFKEQQELQVCGQ